MQQQQKKGVTTRQFILKSLNWWRKHILFQKKVQKSYWHLLCSTYSSLLNSCFLRNWPGKLKTCKNTRMAIALVIKHKMKIICAIKLFLCWKKNTWLICEKAIRIESISQTTKTKTQQSNEIKKKTRTSRLTSESKYTFYNINVEYDTSMLAHVHQTTGKTTKDENPFRQELSVRICLTRINVTLETVAEVERNIIM